MVCMTHRWSEMDSNHWYPEDKLPLGDGLLSPPCRLPEGGSFLSRRETVSSNPSPSSGESFANLTHSIRSAAACFGRSQFDIRTKKNDPVPTFMPCNLGMMYVDITALSLPAACDPSLRTAHHGVVASSASGIRPSAEKAAYRNCFNVGRSGSRISRQRRAMAGLLP